MEDSKITQSEDAGLYQQGAFPSVIDTDDLVFEIGRNIVTKLNHEKLLKSILKKVQVAEAKVLELSKERDAVQPKIESLSSSNKLYEENNRKLSDELVIVRRNLADKEREFTQVSNTLNNERTVHSKEKQTWVDEKNQVIRESDIKYQNLLSKSEHEVSKLREAYQTDIIALEKEKDALNQAKIDLIQENNLLSEKILKKNKKKVRNV